MNETITFKRLYAEAIRNGVPYVLLKSTDLKKAPLTKEELALIGKVGMKYDLVNEGHVLITFNIDKALEVIEDEEVLNVLERFKLIYEGDQSLQLKRFEGQFNSIKSGKELSFSFWAQPRTHGSIAILGDKGFNSYLLGLDSIINILKGKADLVEYDQFYDATYTEVENTEEFMETLMNAVKLDNTLTSFIVTVVKK